MATEFFIPKLGQTVEQVTLVKWLVADGAKVDFGQEVCEVETDKAIFPVEANAKGYIHIGPFSEGEVLPVLTVVAMIGKEGEVFGDKVSGGQGDGELRPQGTGDMVKTDATPSPSHPVTWSPGHQSPASPRARKLAATKGIGLAQVTPTGYEGVRVVERDVVAYLAATSLVSTGSTSDQSSVKPVKTNIVGFDGVQERRSTSNQPLVEPIETSALKATELPKTTPVAARMAADTGVDLRAVTGTGPGGKIIKDDVARAAQPSQPHESRITPPDEIIERIPLKGVRAIIAERMAASIHTGARVTLFAEADATEFVAARERLKAKVAEDWGFAPGYNDLLIKIVAAALRQFPYMNARINAETIEILRPVNIGMAVDTERGLMVPVIRDVDQKKLRQIGSEFRELVERARKERSLPDDLSGGTFTITNLGMYDVDYFTPVINLPEAAILGVGRIAAKVVPFNDQPTIRPMIPLSLAFDHRLVDGAPAAKFLQAIKQMIEEPYLLLAH